jgi:DNA-binding transcriptional ArsR family regulator
MRRDFVASGEENNMSPQTPNELSDADARKQELLLKALADRYRLRILSILKAKKGEISVEELTASFGIDQTTVTYHLNKLCTAGLVDSRKEKRRVFYFIVPERLTEAYMAIRDLTPGVKPGKKSA